jgi:cytochrome c peroxidase
LDGRATGTFIDPLTNQVILQTGAALESQILGPPVADVEMAHSGRNWQQVADRITGAKPLALAVNVPAGLQNWIDGRTYPQLFEEAFDTPEVTPTRIAMTIATHERTLFSDQTPFDQVNQGIGTLTAYEQNGRNLFNGGQTNCNVCHTGNLLTDNQFHYIGLRPSNEDTGRQQVTNNANNSAQFRTPNLRNVELRGAYFHNGNFTTLRQVVDFYARGGDFNAVNKDGNVRPRNLSNQQRDDIAAFLSRPMTDPRVRNELPPFDHPTLYTESSASR